MFKRKENNFNNISRKKENNKKYNKQQISIGDDQEINENKIQLKKNEKNTNFDDSKTNIVQDKYSKSKRSKKFYIKKCRKFKNE